MIEDIDESVREGRSSGPDGCQRRKDFILVLHQQPLGLKKSFKGIGDPGGLQAIYAVQHPCDFRESDKIDVPGFISGAGALNDAGGASRLPRIVSRQEAQENVGVEPNHLRVYFSAFYGGFP